MKKLLLPALTKAMNTYLRLDTESTSRLKKLQGKCITLELLPFHFVFQCVFTESGMDIKDDESLISDTIIRGTPLQMAGVMLAKEDRQRFFADDVIIEGNAELGQQVIALFDELQIDWEEYLSRIVGDVPAYHVGRLINTLGEWLRNTEQTVTQDVSEFIHEEAEWLPAREALQDYFNDIDTLRMDVDRAQARINHLRANLTKDGE